MSIFPFRQKLRSKIESELKKLSWQVDSEKIVQLLEPTIGIKTKKANSKIRIGRSKLGGLPDLSKDLKWPNLNGFPFAFLGQINLSEIKFDKFNSLPKNGLLLFFFSTNQDDYRYENHKDMHRVIFIENLSELEQRNYPENYSDLAKFEECEIKYFEHFSLPSYQNYRILDLNFTDEDDNLLFEASEIINELTTAGEDIGHQILGNAQAVQGDVNYSWALQSIQHKLKTLAELNMTDQNRVLENQKNIKLLLQIDMSDDVPNFSSFGTDGGIYFGIAEEDLAIGNFKNTYFELQNS
tara:strand:- start:512 stop:1399 length:888 start_codon:yes stop_codon:yes gene_type:complete